jgi:hypothetical protein
MVGLERLHHPAAVNSVGSLRDQMDTMTALGEQADCRLEIPKKPEAGG